MNSISFDARDKYTSWAELEARCFAARAANPLIGSFVLSAFPAHLAAQLFASMRAMKFSTVSIREGGELDLTPLVSTEFLKIVDDLEGLYRLRAGEQGRQN